MLNVKYHMNSLNMLLKKNEAAELVIDFKSFNGKGASNTKINNIKSEIMKTLESVKIIAYERHRNKD